ncbi:MAG: glycoside hydrolase family 172 protein, partial [Marinilabilia sp.]
AELPAEGEESGMFSSYDRKSQYDEETGEYVEWSANDDGLSPQYIRKEGDDMVLAEMEGPGAIVRIWSANPEQGHVKIYIDGEEKPVLDMPFRDYFDPSKLPAFNYSNLVYETNARGFNNYVPITFNDSVKVVAEPGWGQYYHFNYIQFPEDQTVEPFNSEPSPDAVKTLGEINKLFGDGLGKPFYETKDPDEDAHAVVMGPGESSDPITIEGRRAITSLRVNVDSLPREEEEELLRKTVMKIRWDDQEEPAVWSPIGDFFGSAPGFNPYETLMMGMEDRDMYSYWYMPFSKRAEIQFQNHSDIPADLDVKVTHEKNAIESDDFGYFHAKWHRDIMPVDSSRWPDWTVLKTEGTGRFVGMFLSVWNPKGGSCVRHAGEGHHWWGEGDEKFFVDGEKFPSTFGTGTEDYFGYAWCVPNFFQHAYHSQNYTEDNMGYQALNRWQIIDNVPFQESFEAYMEKYFPNEWPTQYATVAYWYLDRDGTDPIEPTPAGELYGFEKDYSVFRVDDAIEGEDMRIASNSGGWASNDVFAHETLFKKVSGHKILNWFADPEKENVLKTIFDFEKSGKYRVSANIIRSKEGGQFRFQLNEGALEGQINFHHEEEDEDVRKIDLGIIDMEEGEQELVFEWLEEQSEGGRLSLDYLEFTPVK